MVVEAVYKPVAGERPLDDFPDETLSRREVAAFLVSEAMGWAIVPPTIRRDGPFGDGALQLWIDVDQTVDVVAMVLEDDRRLRKIAVFDAAVNNTDRKGGHLLPVGGGHVYGVDHGVTFSTVPKLRTVLWGWARERLHPDDRDAVAALEARLGEDDDLRSLLCGLLTDAEVAALRGRCRTLLSRGRMPVPSGGWPSIPWPAF